MQIVSATDQDKEDSLEVASALREWFNEAGLKNMRIDFDLNNVLVAKRDGTVAGFLCYTSYCGKMLLMWMGVKPDQQRQGVGQSLITWLEEEAKQLGLHTIEVETLPEEYDYEPYARTRAFYYKNGFTRVYYRKASIAGWADQIVLEKKI